MISRSDPALTAGFAPRTRPHHSRRSFTEFVTMAVDADGLGAGVYDRLIELGRSVGEICGGKAAIEPEDFVNARSEWYWNLRNRFENGDIDIDPNDTEFGEAAG
jgi:hypothetical protein